MEAEINALGQDPKTPRGRARRRDPRARDDRARAPGRSRSRGGAAAPGARRRCRRTKKRSHATSITSASAATGAASSISTSSRSTTCAKPARRPTSSIRRLEEIAQLAELRLGDIPRAIEAWQRIAELEPGSPKVTEALRRLTARGKMWEQLVQSLEHEVAHGRRSGHAHAVAQEDGADVSRASARAAARDRAVRAGASRRTPTTTRR